jgi:UDP-N-acetylmuramoyl-L-alanyl-D-glutamate--2,6-diaminopimelate ligase
VYGVTGTNGKTTTCIVLGTVLREQYGPKKVGLLTTVVFWLGEKEVVNSTKMTTLDSRVVFRRLKQMANAGVEQVVLEVTSHALDQHRLAGVRFDGGIILNLSREHLDYHGDMDGYAKAKGLIVRYLKKGTPLIVNRGNKWARKIVDEAEAAGLEFKAVWFGEEQKEKVKTKLLGRWNKENVLAARLLANEVGISKACIDRGASSISVIPGRMEWVELENRKWKIENGSRLPRVLIDYAVTPDALERVYKEIGEQTKGKVFAVLGACGNRDRGKRPEMAKVVARHADELVLAREDPWTESEEQIFDDLEKGLLDTAIKWKRIVDRKEAIRYCLEKADSDDIVVVTGKGAEVGMAIGKRVVPWSEREVIESELKRLAGKKSS